MKYCPNCKAVVEDNFDVCWNCNFSFVENKVVDFRDTEIKGNRDLDCLRCKTNMNYAGNYFFHEGPKVGVFGVLGEAFLSRISFDIYVCPECGKVEMFIPSIGGQEV